MRNSPLALRLCYCSQNAEFNLPDLALRTKLMADHPVIAARTFKRVIRGFFEIICGVPLDYYTGRKTNIDRLLSGSQSHYIGAFGRLKAVYAVTEEQTGGSLHMHGQLFGMIDQRVLTRWIHDKTFRKDVCKFIDSIVTAEIPGSALGNEQSSSGTTVVGAQPYPTVQQLPLDSAFCRLRMNTHRHSFTCWKGECLTCRMAYPRQRAGRTYITEIIPDPENAHEIIPKRRFPCNLNGDEVISDPPVTNCLSPIDPPDHRVIACGLRRTSEIEQKQTETNTLTSVLMRCNTSIQPTIAPTQARNAVYYSSKYCSKNPYKLSATLSLLYTAQLALRKFGSVADDAGSSSRSTKYLMQKVLHKAGQIEVADQQAAAANLGYDSFFCSHKFCYIFIWDAVKRLNSRCAVGKLQEDFSDDEEFASVLEVDDRGLFFPMSQFDMYIYRSNEFEEMSFHDYGCCIRPLKTKRKPNGASAPTRGRNMLKRYPFEGSGCDFPESLMQRVTTNLRVPILAGAPPPGFPGIKPDNTTEDEFKIWEKSARIFVQFYSLLFLPFREDMDPRDPTLPHLQVLPWNVDTS